MGQVVREIYRPGVSEGQLELNAAGKLHKNFYFISKSSEQCNNVALDIMKCSRNQLIKSGKSNGT